MNLKVNDEYIQNMGDYLKMQYELMGEFLDEYNSIMREAVEKGIAEGATHDALSEFLNQVQMNSAQKYSKANSIGAKYHSFCDDFIRKIKKADRGLYG